MCQRACASVAGRAWQRAACPSSTESHSNRGAASVKQLESNLAALALQLDPQLGERLDGIRQVG